MKLPKDLFSKENIYPVKIFITPRGFLYSKVGPANGSTYMVQPNELDDYCVWEQKLYGENVKTKTEEQLHSFRAECFNFAFGPHPFYTHLKTESRLEELEYKLQLLEGRVL
jgi:hypothetical protein